MSERRLVVKFLTVKFTLFYFLNVSVVLMTAETETFNTIVASIGGNKHLTQSSSPLPFEVPTVRLMI